MIDLSLHWTVEQYQEYLKRTGKTDKLGVQPKKKHKYNSKPGEMDGIKFKSQKEIERYCELKLLKAAGVILKVEYEPDKFRLPGGITYTPDFKLTYPDHIEYEEVKGFETPEYKLKMRLFKETYPDVTIKVIK